MPGATCPYCGRDHYYGVYVEVHPATEALSGRGYNKCTGCELWSEYNQEDESQHELPLATEPIPNREQVE